MCEEWGNFRKRWQVLETLPVGAENVIQFPDQGFPINSCTN